jgi:hypothetical protein
VSKTPTNNVVIAKIIIFFTPVTSINAAIKGPDIPYRRRLIAKANEIVERSHPNSASKGTINTPDDDRIIPAIRMEKKAMNKITQL